MTKQTPLSAAKIDDARKKIDPIFLNTNLLRADRLALSLVAKDETENPIRSFKGRGTGYFLADVVGDRTPLVTASAGNFGQGLAYNAARHGRSLVVFASINANPLKIEAMRRFGAEVFLAGEDFDAAKEAAKIYAAERKLQFVEDGASAAIAEGAGTIAAELTEEVEDIDAVFIPLGNGALAAGIGCWFKSRSPRTRVVAVAAKGAPCMALSYNAGDVISTPEARTIADGIAVRIPVPSAVGWLKDTIDDVVLVDDDQLLDAMRFAHDTWKRLVEPAGAAGLAAILEQASALKGCRVATMLCGANLTDQQIKAWLPSAIKHNTNAC
ncbi:MULTISPECIES: threonine ammonia-lyase [Rhizobium]|uniref:threonine ammonia-lyase n=1 Tax=Rhizobium TaxID=379 RepID=UPI000FEC3A15|nr:pyridoxal-phosphate dependent enzyme [Rhizobium leguminosarum]MBY2918086.1 pyridoxal-phosphate dependent enzyme [Rhizobium leguminosarum]MBY2941100.1 pyridoxal-phosphate dependent enzyme [Rhizobium leguminosarum]MBY2973436.1 pyridoxal-phosphate dependent enzyme [Rhizobium leguminosarum]MBY2980836.1 pyridoxal-phosphate dependent enzyme [Rhizobium leguminosarum]MBY2983788.1 pyridoxal-phosphate dependent enzyme [Rhizobium leguminosarum]